MCNNSTEDKNRFPICFLKNNILHMLQSLNSIDWMNITSDGLNKNIRLDDFYGPITNIASLDSLNRIHISLAYCQFLWSICYVACNTYDCNNVQREVQALDAEELEQFKKELLIGRNDKIVKELMSYLNPTDIFEKCYPVFEAGALLINSSIETSGFNHYYEQPNALEEENSKINAIYCYAVVFIICHEIGHFSLKHTINTSIGEEESADSYSFWSLYSDVEEENKISAMIGTLTGLCSLMFFSYDLSGDDQHPNEDKRIMDSLSLIKDEYPHYIGFVLQIFKMWAYFFEKHDFPDLAQFSTDEEALNAVLLYVRNTRNSI